MTNRPHGSGEHDADGILKAVAALPRLLTRPVAGMDDAIDAMLGRVGHLLGASRTYVMLDEKDGKYLRNTHEWVCSSTGPVMFSWPLYDYEYDVPSLKDLLDGGRALRAKADGLPPDLAHVLAKQGVAAIVLAPVERDGRRLGLAGADFCSDGHEPRPEAETVLEALASLVALALERKDAQCMRVRLAGVRAVMADVDPLLAGVGDGEDPTLRPAKPTTLVDAERRLIVETLELYNGNKLKTARHLGLTWPSLDRRCKKLGIEVRRR